MRRLTLALALFLLPAFANAQDVKGLLKKLDSPKSDERFDALMALADLGPKAAPAVDRLAAMLTKFDEDERVPAILALGKIGESALQPLDRLLTHEDETTRHDAAWALALVGRDAKVAAPRLLKLTQSDPDDDVRSKAVYALGQIVPKDRPTLDALSKLLGDAKTPAAVKIAIVEHLRHWGEPAIPVLGPAMPIQATGYIAQQSLAHVLDKHQTNNAAEAMLPFVVDAYTNRWLSHTTMMVGQFATTAPTFSDLHGCEGMAFVVKIVGIKLIPALEAKLSSKDASEREKAITVLGSMGKSLIAHHTKTPSVVMSMTGPYLSYPPETPVLAERIVKALLPMMRHADPATRAAAVGIMPLTKSSEAARMAALTDEDLNVRTAAHFSLMSYDGRWQTTLWRRLATAKGAEQLRLAALQWHEPQAWKVIISHLNSQDAALRQEAACVIGTNRSFPGQDSPQVKKALVPAWVEGLKSDNPSRRQWSAMAMSMNGLSMDNTCIPALIAALKDKDASIRRDALAALSQSSHADRPEILAAAEPFLRDADVNMRVTAIYCVAYSGKNGVPMLIKMLAEEKESHIRQQLTFSLAEHRAPGVTEALLKAAEDTADWQYAAAALLRLDEKANLPKVLAVLAKKDDAARRTLAKLPIPDTISGVAKAVAPLLDRDDPAVCSAAAHTLAQLAPLILQPDLVGWRIATLSAFDKRLPKLKTKLQSKDLAERREAMTLLVQLTSLQQTLRGPMLRFQGVENNRVQDLHKLNLAFVNELLGMARSDADLTIRRQARKALQQQPPW